MGVRLPAAHLIPLMRFTWSTNALNECGSFTANSASTFLSTHTFSEPSACMNSLYLTCANENERERKSSVSLRRQSYSFIVVVVVVVVVIVPRDD